jgi:hypothetical protein
MLMHNDAYAASFDQLREYCRQNKIALQTIKSAARRKYPDRNWTHQTWYQPLSYPEAIRKAVTWVMGIPEIFVVSSGDLTVLPHILSAAAGFAGPPEETQMQELVQEQAMEPLFT